VGLGEGGGGGGGCGGGRGRESGGGKEGRENKAKSRVDIQKYPEYATVTILKSTLDGDLYIGNVLGTDF
jgi:hypothetical protein